MIVTIPEGHAHRKTTDTNTSWHWKKYCDCEPPKCPTCGGEKRPKVYPQPYPYPYPQPQYPNPWPSPYWIVTHGNQINNG